MDARSGNDLYLDAAGNSAVLALPGAGRWCWVDRSLVSVALSGRRVVATDIGTTFLTELSAPNLQVRRADTHGADLRWGRQRLPIALAEAGLVELGMSMSVKCVGGGGPAEAFYRFSMAQARGELVGRGLLSEAEYTAGMAPLDDPAIIDAPVANLAVWGRATGR